MVQSSTLVPSLGYRLLTRHFFCHACQKEFQKQVNVPDEQDSNAPPPTVGVTCTNCNSDFVELQESREAVDAMETYHEEVRDHMQSQAIASELNRIINQVNLVRMPRANLN
jgi:transposase-like protein